MPTKKELPEKPKGHSPMSKQAMYNMVASRGRELIEGLFEDTYSKNPTVRISARKTLINKILPDLKATELVDNEGKPVPIYTIMANVIQRNNSHQEDSQLTEKD